VRLALKVVMQDDGDFVDVFLQYTEGAKSSSLRRCGRCPFWGCFPWPHNKSIILSWLLPGGTGKTVRDVVYVSGFGLI